MISRGVACGITLCVGLFAGGLIGAQAPPPVTVSVALNPNLAAAQKLIGEAYTYVTAAQNANNYDMADHAVHVKLLLTQASQELQVCANLADAAAAAAAKKK
jgi:hypothetical protein